MTYANTLRPRLSVNDNLCGFSFGAVTAAGVPTTLARRRRWPHMLRHRQRRAADSASTVDQQQRVRAVPRTSSASVSPSTGCADFNLDGALCLRKLWTGTDAEAQRRCRRASTRSTRSANLRGKPAIIVHGRDDALVPVNHSVAALLRR